MFVRTSSKWHFLSHCGLVEFKAFFEALQFIRTFLFFGIYFLTVKNAILCYGKPLKNLEWLVLDDKGFLHQ